MSYIISPFLYILKQILTLASVANGEYLPLAISTSVNSCEISNEG